MQPDPARVAETREWFAKAALDLRAADFEFTAQPPLTADIVFHCQQLAEKSTPGGFATRARWREPPLAEAQAALALAREVYEAILSRLPGEVRP